MIDKSHNNYTLSIYFNLSTIALVYSEVEALPPKSPVIDFPSANVSKIAASILFAYSFKDI